MPGAPSPTLEDLRAAVTQGLRDGTLGSRLNLGNAIQQLSSRDEPATATARATSLLEIAEYLYLYAEPREALPPAETAVDLARECGNRQLLRRALSTLGIMAADARDLPRAFEAYDEALSLAVELNDPMGQAIAWCNAGIAFYYGGLHRASISSSRMAIQAAAALPRKSADNIVAASHANLALAYLSLREYDAGLQAIRKPGVLLDEANSLSDSGRKAVREVTYTQLLLAIGDIDGAMARAEVAEQHARTSKSKRRMAIASVVRGLCLVHAGQHSEGLALIEESLQAGSQHYTITRCIEMALVQAYEHAGRLTDALAMLERISAATQQSQVNLVDRKLRTLDYLGKAIPEAEAAPGREALHMALTAKAAEREYFSAKFEMLEKVALVCEMREGERGLHIYRVGKLSAMFARELGWNAAQVGDLELSARLHDIGKMAVPDAVIAKQDALSGLDRQFIETHTRMGAEYVGQLHWQGRHTALAVVRHHHERWDGSGYPDQLAGDAIPLPARIVAITDAFDAMTHARGNREPMSVAAAIERIREGAGKQFDPTITEPFIRMVLRYRDQYEDLEEFLCQDAIESPLYQAHMRLSSARRSKP